MQKTILDANGSHGTLAVIGVRYNNNIIYFS